MQSGSAYGHQDDIRLAKLAARQHGVVSWWQLRALGYSKRAIYLRCKSGHLHRIYRGVYGVGHTRLSVKGRWMAAVLACGPDAVLSHGAAAALWELQNAPSGKIDVTSTSRHAIRGVRCHFSRTPLHPDDRTIIDGIPVTSISRTLLDQAEVLRHQRLRSTVEAAQRRDLLDSRKLDPLLERSFGRRGVTPLRRVLSELHDEAPWTQSHLEQRFLELIRDAGLPEPRTNVIVDGELVDCFWPQHNLVVELDSFGFHRSKRSFEDDRRKDTRHTLAGRRSMRVTRARVEREQRALLGDLSVLLAEPQVRSGQ